MQAKKFPSDGRLWENDMQTADTSKCDSGVCDKLKAVLWAFCLLSEHHFFDFSISVNEKQKHELLCRFFGAFLGFFGFSAFRLFDLQNFFYQQRSTIASHQSIALDSFTLQRLRIIHFVCERIRPGNFRKGLFNCEKPDKKCYFGL